MIYHEEKDVYTFPEKKAKKQVQLCHHVIHKVPIL